MKPFIRGHNFYFIQLLGRTKSSTPNLQTPFWWIPQVLFPHFHMLMLCGWVIGGHRRPTHPRKGSKTERHLKTR